MGSCLCSESRTPRSGSPRSPAFRVRKRKNSKKRPGSRNSSFDYGREESLHRIPGRMFLNDSSEVVSLFTRQGKKGINQDAMLAWENFGSRTDTIFCGVFDGHGPYGHMVAKRVRDSLPLRLSAHWEVNESPEAVSKEINLISAGSMNSDDTAYVSADGESRASVDLEESVKLSENFRLLKESFLKAFKVMDGELKEQSKIDCFCSGTTAVTLVKQGLDLVIGNVGDSRAVLGTIDDDNALVAVQLTVDLKPNLPAEAARIRRCKGRVFSLQDEPEVARVWLPNSDAPGLAMARAFGDFCLKDFGLISVPDVSYRRLSDKDKFIVLATDGIWDVLSNEEVVEIVASVSSRSHAARVLVESAVRGWRYKYPTSKADDCAAVCLYLDSTADGFSTASVSNPRDQQSSEEQVDLDSKTGNLVFGPNKLNRAGTVRTGEETALAASEVENLLQEDDFGERSGTEWSAIEGVARVNTLVNLPRFVPGDEENGTRVTKERSG